MKLIDDQNNEHAYAYQQILAFKKKIQINLLQKSKASSNGRRNFHSNHMILKYVKEHHILWTFSHTDN